MCTTHISTRIFLCHQDTSSISGMVPPHMHLFFRCKFSYQQTHNHDLLLPFPEKPEHNRAAPHRCRCAFLASHFTISVAVPSVIITEASMRLILFAYCFGICNQFLSRNPHPARVLQCSIRCPDTISLQRIQAVGWTKLAPALFSSDIQTDTPKPDDDNGVRLLSSHALPSFAS